MKITVLEKESEVAGHQSGHNSGVLHAGAPTAIETFCDHSHRLLCLLQEL